MPKKVSQPSVPNKNVSLKQTGKFSALDIASSGWNPSITPKPQKQSTNATTTEKSTANAEPAAPTIDIEQLILTTVAKNGCISDTWEFAEKVSIEHQVIVGVLKSLLVDLYLVDEPLSLTYWTVTSEGQDVLKNGSPEIQVYNAIPSDGITVAALNAAVGDVAKIGMGACMKNKWITKNGDIVVRTSPDEKSDDTAALLKIVAESVGAPHTQQGLLSAAQEADLKNLKKRKLVTQVTRKSFKVNKGPEYQDKRVKKVAELSKSMLGNKAEMPEGSTHWSDLSFKTVNLKSMGAPVLGGTFHPLLKVRAEFRRILMEMGFEEMPTSKWVESSFWNFDALFQPQSHPARDAHDTFFLKSPAAANAVPEEYYERVKRTHENGGDSGSIGYGCVFKRDETLKNILRTHTTAISAQMLYKLGQSYKEALTGGQQSGNTGDCFTAKKYFSIDRVFRNEAMDATHLCEFHQVEGLVADRNLSLGHLIGTIKAFFEKIGITQLRFKPAYNPYTEPSMEIFGYHPELKKWTEIGNSGMFRPEMLQPMGLPPDVRVIAWGLSLERPTMIKYKIENIRDLFGHKADLPKQRAAPIARF